MIRVFQAKPGLVDRFASRGGFVVAAMLGLGLVVPPCAAQTNGTADLPPAAHRDGTKIPEKIEKSGSSAEPLSDRLNRSSGVIHPSKDPDPGMAKPTPNLGPQSTPVIPPPGTTGESGLNPK